MTLPHFNFRINPAQGWHQIYALFELPDGTFAEASNAVWFTAGNYTVTYNGNGHSGGSVPADNNKYASGQSVTVLGNTGSLIKSGYEFLKWNTAENISGTDYESGAVFTMGSANVNLYTRWSPEYAWTKTLSGTNTGTPTDVITDGSGNIYVTGIFNAVFDFDPGSGADPKTSAGENDIFLTKINTDGSYAWTKTMGGISNDQPVSIFLDNANNIFLAGYFMHIVDFDPGTGTDSKTSAGSNDIFLTKISSDGSYAWTKTMGGIGEDYCNDSVMDSAGNIFLAGSFDDTVDFDPEAGTDNKTSAGDSDLFLTKINSNSSYGWTKTMGSTGTDRANAVVTDSSNSVFIAGIFYNTVDFDPGAGTDNKTSAGSADLFLTKINSDGTYGWTKTFGGTSWEYVVGINADSSGNIFITGYFTLTADFDPETSTDNRTSKGGYDIFLTKFNNNGNYAWTKTLGSTGFDVGYDIAIDNSGNIYLTGYFHSTVDFDPGAGIDNITSAGGADIFLLKLNSDGGYAWAKTMGSSGYDIGMAITIDLSDNVFSTGFFENTVDFNPGTGTDIKTSAGSYDIFLTKFIR
ncbi:MAG: hypothetical protein A2096_00860 [Spirochaetes bacterium GWF1_41_5]|nr:MAG: hypothetical protein A2096_00860 [Spirochaetes bacterium GWF1_41_5]